MNTPKPEDTALFIRVRGPLVDLSNGSQMIADHCAPLRELAEIGRIAVELERLHQTPLSDPDGSMSDHLEDEMDLAIDNYITKHPTA